MHMTDSPSQRRPFPRGIAAVAVIVILVIVDLVVVGVVLSESRGHDVTVQRLETVRAYYAAEAGIHMAMRELVFQENQDDDCAIGTISNDGIDANDPALGTASFMVTAVPSGSQYAIRAYGRSGGARREMSALFDVSVGGGGGGEITMGGTVGNIAGGGTPMGMNLACDGGSDRIFVIMISKQTTHATDWDVTNMWYNSQPMTKAAEHHLVEAVPMDYHTNVEIWYLLEADMPAAGSYPFAFTPGTTSGVHVVTWLTLTDAAQQAPVTNDGEFLGGYGITTDITTTSANTFVVEMVHQRTSSAIFTPQNGQTQLYLYTAFGSSLRQYGVVESAGTASRSTTSSNPAPLIHALAGFAPK
jgi:hypothetical protein